MTDTTLIRPDLVPPDDLDAPTCPRCDYDLRALPPGTDRCPECGLPVEPGRMPESQIPWVHRRRIGSATAYLRTVALVSYGSDRFAAQFRRPLDLKDARPFWLITVLLLVPPVAVLASVSDVFNSKFVNDAATAIAEGKPSVAAWVTPVLFGANIVGVRVACALACLVALVRPPGPLRSAHTLPPGRRQRAAALAYYAGAPLLHITAAAAALVLVALLRLNDPLILTAVLLLGALVTVLAVVAWWWVQVRLVHTATGSTASAARFGLLLPIRWLGVAVVFLFVIPWVVGYCQLLLANLR